MNQQPRFPEWTRSCAILGFLGILLAGCAHFRPEPFTFVQMCDPQLGYTNYVRDLRHFELAVQQINQLMPDFVVICGDLVNDPRPDTFGDFNKARRQLKMPSYCAPGNHDLGNAPTLASLKLYRTLVGRDYFRFENKGCTFLVLNTQIWKSPVAGETEKQDAWLERALADAHKRGRPIFVVEHYPPFVKTAEEPDAYFNLPMPKRRELLAAFQRNGVKAVLAGHTHTTTNRSFGPIEIVNSETTSQNFDNRPFGFRLWHVNQDGSFWHEFVPLQNTESTNHPPAAALGTIVSDLVL
jgi:serine/threonine-protein phosphatase CPPED1